MFVVTLNGLFIWSICMPSSLQRCINIHKNDHNEVQNCPNNSKHCQDGFFFAFLFLTAFIFFISTSDYHLGGQFLYPPLQNNHAVHQEEMRSTEHAAEIKLSMAFRYPLELKKIVQPILTNKADKFSLGLNFSPEDRSLQCIIFSSSGDIFPPVKFQLRNAISNQL